MSLRVDTANIRVNVEEFDDPLTFDQRAYTFRINEGVPTIPTIGQVRATDPEGATVTYGLVGAPTGFTINNAGVISYDGIAFNHSVTPRVTFVARASAGAHTADANITIEITNIISTAFSQSAYSFIVSNIATPPVNIGNVFAVAEDGSDITYRSDDNRFTVSNTGQVMYVGARIDTLNPVPTEFRFNITATPATTPNVPATVPVLVSVVTIAPDRPVVFTPDTYNFFIPENTTFRILGTITATDADNDPITYRLVGAPPGIPCK